MSTTAYEAATNDLHTVFLAAQALRARMKSDMTHFVLMHEEHIKTNRDAMAQAYSQMRDQYCDMATLEAHIQTEHEAVEHGIHQPITLCSINDPEAVEAIKAYTTKQGAKVEEKTKEWGDIMTYWNALIK